MSVDMYVTSTFEHKVHIRSGGEGRVIGRVCLYTCLNVCKLCLCVCVRREETCKRLQGLTEKGLNT